MMTQPSLDRPLTLSEFRYVVRKRVGNLGGIRPAGRALHVPYQHLHRFLHSDRMPWPNILKAFGYTKETWYRKVKP